jgi:16S rRNA C967 or C1407 C5-methylase (RsmB/RsmF family)
MKRPFREHHLLSILHSFDSQRCPLDLYLRNYFRAHKAVGAHDRRFIADTLYGVLRWRGLLDHLLGERLSWQERVALFLRLDLQAASRDPAIPSHIRVSFPKNLYLKLETAYGTERALELCLASNEAAPTTVRANLLKTSRDALLQKWAEPLGAVPCLHASAGVSFPRKTHFFSMQEFKDGCFEVQDEASQLIAALVEAHPGDHVLDFCAGSGGKALAVAPGMQHKGTLYLHDVRHAVLSEAKKRLRRAGVQNAVLLPADSPHKKALRHRMDWVLVDAPCSGTGTLRRNPDMKWKFHLDTLACLVNEQRAIFQEALKYLKPFGTIVYATCSILPEENEEQVTYFRETYKLELVRPLFYSFPKKGGMDGFFGAVLRKASSK